MKYVVSTSKRSIILTDPVDVANVILEDNYTEELFDEFLNREYEQFWTRLYFYNPSDILHAFPDDYRNEYEEHIELEAEYIRDCVKDMAESSEQEFYEATIKACREREYTVTLSEEELDGIVDCVSNKVVWGREGEDGEYLRMLDQLYNRLSTVGEYEEA